MKKKTKIMQQQQQVNDDDNHEEKSNIIISLSNHQSSSLISNLSDEDKKEKKKMKKMKKKEKENKKNKKQEHEDDAHDAVIQERNSNKEKKKEKKRNKNNNNDDDTEKDTKKKKKEEKKKKKHKRKHDEGDDDHHDADTIKEVPPTIEDEEDITNITTTTTKSSKKRKLDNNHINNDDDNNNNHYNNNNIDRQQKHDDKQQKTKKHEKQNKANVTKVSTTNTNDDITMLDVDIDLKAFNNTMADVAIQSSLSSLSSSYPLEPGGRPLVESSALFVTTTDNDSQQQQNDDNTSITLVLFYQYVEPTFDDRKYQSILKHMESIGKKYIITGRMRIANEGFNCTLTSTKHNIYNFIQYLRKFNAIFLNTEFKCTHDLPTTQRFPILKIIPVKELVNYGLDGKKAPSIKEYSGVHLEPIDYHQKLADPNTIIIDVRNHYEAIIGRFDPPTISNTTTTEENNNPTNLGVITTTTKQNNGDVNNNNENNESKWLDPKMRKSTEFPIWLNDPITKEKLRNKQVLMYCTGGIRCERASALLQYKINNDDTMKDLNIQGVYQLQGGIDKYFKEFPDGGYWKGKNYVFDKRFVHAPIEKEKSNNEPSSKILIEQGAEVSLSSSQQQPEPMSQCEGCRNPWDQYRGKRRCPTCGVPSLICKDCYQLDYNGIKKLDYTIRCDLCIEQNIYSKKQLNDKIQKDLEQYEYECKKKGIFEPKTSTNNNNKEQQHEQQQVSNTNNITRLYIKNMCRKNMTEEILMKHIPDITHIVLKIRDGELTGQGWVEMLTPKAAEDFVSKSGTIKILGRLIYVEYQPPNSKDIWPPKNHAVFYS